jgi:hypothetical protein
MPVITAAPADSPCERAGPQLERHHKAIQATFGTRFLNTFASPYQVIEDHVIQCPVAVRFYKKDFNYLSKQLYLEYQYRKWRDFDPTLLDRYAAVTTGKLAALDVTMQQTINRLQKLLEQSGQQADLTLWATKYVTDVPIIAAQARAYLTVLQKMDRVYTLTGTANLLGVIDSTQRAQAELQAKRAVRAFRSILQTEVPRLYREAERIMTQQRQVGKADPAMAAVVQQQQQDIAEFEQAAQRDAHEDGSALQSGAVDQAGADACAVLAA